MCDVLLFESTSTCWFFIWKHEAMAINIIGPLKPDVVRPFVSMLKIVMTGKQDDQMTVWYIWYYTVFVLQLQDWLQGAERIRQHQARHRGGPRVRHGRGGLGRQSRGGGWGGLRAGGGGRGGPARGRVHPAGRGDDALHAEHDGGPGGQGPRLDEHLLQPLRRRPGRSSLQQPRHVGGVWRGSEAASTASDCIQLLTLVKHQPHNRHLLSPLCSKPIATFSQLIKIAFI